jgi:hypothetical protein
LGKIRDPRAVEPLVAVLKDVDYGVRENAAKALGKDAVEPLIATLKDPDPNARISAAKALAEIGPEAVEPLIAALEDPNPDARFLAADALGKIKDPRAVEPLVAVLKDADYGVRENAAKALGKDAVEPLIATLKDPDSSVRQNAAEALGNIKDPGFPAFGFTAAVKPLAAALKDSDSNVRKSAAKALGEIKDPDAVEPLIAALKDPDSYVQKSAANALVKIEDPRGVRAALALLRVPVFTSPQGFSITPPDGWAVLSKGMASQMSSAVQRQFPELGSIDFDKMAVVIFNPADPIGSQNLNVVVSPGKTRIGESGAPEKLATSLRDQYGRMGVTVRSVTRKIFGTHAALVADTESNLAGSPVRQWQVMLPTGSDTLIVTCTAPRSSFDDVAPTFTKAIESMQYSNFEVPAWLRDVLIGAILGGLIGLFKFLTPLRKKE